VTPVWFDIALLELIAPLTVGAKVVVAGERAGGDGVRLRELWRDEQVSWMQATPSTWRLVQQAGGVSGGKLLSGGEALSKELAAGVMSGGGELWNLYGPTETTVWSAIYRCVREESGVVIPIGRPLSQTQVYVLDEGLEATGVGAVGELYIGGAGLARGYLGQAGLTAERFLPDGLGRVCGGRLYRTGDRARWRWDGELEFLGRVDEQVKIRGYRIETGEIEAMLESEAGVSQAAVVAQEQGEGDRRLVGFVTGAGAQELDGERLRQALGRKLPEYMVPWVIKVVERLPRTPNGKLDRRALERMVVKRSGSAVEEWQRMTPVEEVLSGIWRQVLGLERVGRGENFFHLGGHSLLAAQVISRVREAFGVEIGLREMFQSPTIERLAEAVEKGRGAARVRPQIKLKSGGGVKEAPLSFAQQRLWFIGELDPHNFAYNINVAVRLKGKLNMAALQSSVDEVVGRHESLRTVFSDGDGEPKQIIRPPESVPITFKDLGSMPEAARNEEALGFAREEAEKAFDLKQWPLMRVGLLRLDKFEHVLNVTMHHIVTDGWSLSIFINDFTLLYQAYGKGGMATLEPLSVQYADYALWQREWLVKETLQELLHYWNKKLSGAPDLLDLPADRPRPAEPSYRGGRIKRRLNAELSRMIKAASRKESVTDYMLMLAAFAAMLSRYLGEEDIVIGTPIAGREHVETEKLIGLFVNTVVIRTEVKRRSSFKEALAGVREAVLDAHAHQAMPFEKLVEYLRPERSLSYSPLFQVMFDTLVVPVLPPLSGELDVSYFDTGFATAKFDLRLSIAEEGDSFTASMEYSLDLFDESTVERMMSHYEVLFNEITRNVNRSISEIELLTVEEQRQVLLEWNHPKKSYDGICIHELFEVQAEKTPQAIAVVSEAGHLSYRELNERANQLGHYLMRRGIGPDSLVGVCVERGLEMLVGLLGVLKAGGAYLPLDPSYPAERLAYMLEDSASAVLLTQRRLLPTLSPQRAASVCLDTDWPLLDGMSEENPAAATLRGRLAYVIYTSGSTGRPKGVAIEHRTLSNFLAAMALQPGIAPDDTLLAVTSLSFDIAGLELFLPLVTGAKIVCASREAAADPRALSALLRRHGVSMMQATPSTWRMMLEQDWSDFPRELKILCGGEALPVDLAQALLNRAPVIWNMYGPTETTIWSAVEEVTRDQSPPAIGRPIANTQIYILDGQGRLSPVGVAGELHIGGAGLARGYLNRPELTAEKFIASPFGGASGARLYKTGDLARYKPDGRIEYLGRLDHQVKIRGFRIELGEIETALAQHPQVKQCVVVAREDAPGDKRLAAYVVAHETSEIVTSAELDDQIRFSLFFFGADTYQQEDKYRLYLESARFADQNGFEAVWTPERHFHEVGSLYPNPAILSAALSIATRQVKLRAGSVVLPLHNPIRVAEEWSVVDNLSQGRVGVSIASGWHPRDFALAPQNYAGRREAMWSGLEKLRSLWRGETLEFQDGAGKQSEIRIYPKPIQAELPIWVTAAGNPETFIEAGKVGANLLTHLLGQTIEEVGENIRLYRESLAEHGYDPKGGQVSLMIHAYVGEDYEETLERARGPFISYMRSHLGLLEAFAKSLDLPGEKLAEENLDAIVSFAFERYTRTVSLIGTERSCLPVVNRMREIGVNELACLIDWMEAEDALAGLRHLAALRLQSRKVRPSSRDLCEHIKAMLPDYMTPSSFVFLDSLPLLHNGKIDRHALPEPPAIKFPDGLNHHQLKSPVETELAAIWEDLLHVDGVGVADSFFDLGGHSLLAMQMITVIRRRFAIDFELKLLFTSPTLGALAERIEEMMVARTDPLTIDSILVWLEALSEEQAQNLSSLYSNPASF
jgi:natural product biosynthesis luciferase-like monooxygenase protein/amino acid adenylation domain-containing protein